MTGPGRTRVLLVDDHAVVRSGLAAFLMAFDDLELVGQAASGEDALRLCDELEPDVVLMDLVMPGMDGATATRLIRNAHPDVQVVILTSFPENDLIQRALEAGAIGYLIKNAQAGELVNAIRAARAGQLTLAPEATEALAQAEKLEQLARALLDAPPDASTLPDLLREHVPAIFLNSRIEIRLFPGLTLLRYPADASPVAESIWEWVAAIRETHCFLPGSNTAIPWGSSPDIEEPLILSPILDIENGRSMGGIYVSKRDGCDAAHLPPAARALAAQIASAAHRSQVYVQTLAHERVMQELAAAEEVQASFLPDTPPEIPGWQFAAVLEPARETSGDFYDFVPLSNGRLGLVIADVAGKGMGAALYMALCRTLLRTFAFEYHDAPHRVIEATNRRILSDAHASLFATVFYAVLDPLEATLTYCNAGHNPPILMRAGHHQRAEYLERTGIVLGAFENSSWQQASVHIEPGDVLLLYTDGVTDAQNRRKEFFGGTRLLQTMQSAAGATAEEIKAALVAELRRFTGDALPSADDAPRLAGDAPRFDDSTLVVVTRDWPLDQQGSPAR